jgi:hypothetical protein
MEEAIGKFMEGLEGQERACFSQIHRLLQRLLVPVQKDTSSMHAEAIEGDFLPNMSEEEQKRFTPSELVSYKHSLEYKWTIQQLKKVTLRQPEFDSKEVDPDLHKQMEKAVQDGRIKCFKMREGPADGDQDLNSGCRAGEIMEDPVFSLQWQSEVLVRDGPGRGWQVVVWQPGKCRSGISDRAIEVHTLSLSVYLSVYIVYK